MAMISSTPSRISISWRSNLLLILLLLSTFVGLGNAAAETTTEVSASASAGADVTGTASAPIEPEAGLLSALTRLAKATINGVDPLANRGQDVIDGVERLTDENYLTEVEGYLGGEVKAEDEVWVVLVHGRKEDLTSSKYLEAHKDAAQLARSELEGTTPGGGNGESPLSKVRWARLDYVTDWELCSKWLLTKPPYLVFISDKGKTLRFMKPVDIRPDAPVLLEGLRSGQWRNVPVWESRWAPGGDRAYLVQYYITISSTISKKTSAIPGWVKMMIGGLIAQQLLGWLHAGNTGVGHGDNTVPGRPQTQAGARAGARAGAAGQGRKDQ